MAAGRNVARSFRGARRALATWAAACALALALGSACGPAQSADEARAEAEVDRDPYSFHRSLGVTLLRAGEPEQAMSHFRRLERMRSDEAEPAYLLGRAYMAIDLYDQAEDFLRAAIDSDPDYAAAHAALGILLDATRRHERATRAHRRSVALAPRRPGYHNNLGFSLYLQERYEDALEAYRRALSLDASSRRIHNNLGFAYGQLGALDRASRHFERAGTPAEAKNNLGMVHEERGELEAAYDLYLEAAELAPALEPARGNLERIADPLGEEVPDLPPEPEPEPVRHAPGAAAPAEAPRSSPEESGTDRAGAPPAERGEGEAPIEIEELSPADAPSGDGSSRDSSPARGDAGDEAPRGGDAP